MDDQTTTTTEAATTGTAPADAALATDHAATLSAELLALDAALRAAGSSTVALLVELARHSLGVNFVQGLHLDAVADAADAGE